MTFVRQYPLEGPYTRVAICSEVVARAVISTGVMLSTSDRLCKTEKERVWGIETCCLREGGLLGVLMYSTRNASLDC